MHEANDHCGSESKKVPNAQGELRSADQEHRALDLNAGSYRDGEHLWLTGIADALLRAIAWSQTRLLCVRWFSFGAWTRPGAERQAGSNHRCCSASRRSGL